MKKSKKTFQDRSSLGWKFFAITLPLSWLFWIPAAFLQGSEIASLTFALHFLGLLAPAAAAFFLIRRHYTPEEQGDFWSRASRIRGIKRENIFFILALAPILWAIAGFFDRAMGGDGLIFEAGQRFTGQFGGFIAYMVFLLFFGPIPVELGWRGLAQDRLQDRYKPLIAGLIIGLFWTIWHLPLFFIEGSAPHALGFGTAGFWLYLAEKLPQSILMAWLFNRNSSNTLSAILFHFMAVLTGELFAISLRGEIAVAVLWWLAALLVVILWRPVSQVKKRH